MKQILSILLILITFGNSYGSKPSTFMLGTYNLRCLTDFDVTRGDQWSSRKGYAMGLIRFHEFDIFGTQELVYSQIKDMITDMPEYSYVGAGRDDGDKKGEHVAIFYRTDRFEVLESGYFWLSEDETKPQKGWDAAYVRICSWAEFKDKESGFKFLYYNVHLDNEGELARKESIKMIIYKANAAFSGIPIVIAGDFNASEDSEVYRMLSEGKKLFDAHKTAEFVYANNSSYNDFKAEGTDSGLIDYIFLTPEFKVKKYGLLTDVYRSVDANGIAKARTPSDHFPIILKIEVK